MHHKVLCRYLGGSNLYQLTTPTSDKDERGVFANTDVAHILGTRRFDEDRRQTKEEDWVMKEFSHFMHLLASSNTEALECLWAPDNAFSFIDQAFATVRMWKADLVGSEKLYNCLRGYMSGELRNANGAKTGELGGKRRASLDQYGFSPKNFVQLFRLAKLGEVFFQTGKVVVDCREFGDDFHGFLMDVKTQPGNWTKESLNARAAQAEAALTKAYEGRTETFTFNEDLTNTLLLRTYYPFLQKAYER